MIYNNPFLASLILSIAIHATFFFALPVHVIKPSRDPRPIVVYYQQGLIGQTEQKAPDSSVPDISKSEDLSKIKTSKEYRPLWEKARLIHEFIRDEIFREDRNLSLFRKPPTKGERERKSITMPNIPGEAHKTPEYKSYYQRIRQKIKKYAYYHYKKLQEGEVFLTFSLSADGRISNVKIDKDKSTRLSYLHGIATKSIKSAAPYPPFPKKLKKHKRLSFNVIISFELK